MRWGFMLEPEPDECVFLREGQALPSRCEIIAGQMHLRLAAIVDGQVAGVGRLHRSLQRFFGDQDAGHQAASLSPVAAACAFSQDQQCFMPCMLIRLTHTAPK